MSTRKNQVLGPAFFKRLAVSKGSAFGPRPRGRNPPMIPKDQEGQPKRPGGTFWRRGTLSRGSPQDAVLQKRINKTRASKKKRQPFRPASAGFRFVFQYRKSHRPFHPSPRPPEPNRKPSGHIGFLPLADAISAPEKSIPQSCRNFSEIPAAETCGRPAGRLSPIFGLRPRRNEQNFAFRGKREGLCPPPASLLKKAGPKT